MALFIARKALSFLRKIGVIEIHDFHLARLLFHPDITQEDYEKLQWCDLFKKIEAEPDNPYNYWHRGNMRMSKLSSNRLGVIEDFTQVIRLVLDDRERYLSINLSFCYLSICENANIYGNFLMENTDFVKSSEYYELSISTGREFLRYEDRSKMYDDECEDYIKKSSDRLTLIR